MSRKQGKTVTIFVTSRALTEGIATREARPVASMPNYMEAQALGARGERGHTTWFSPGAYRLDMASAVARAKEMQTKRLAHMEKQMAQIRALTFEEVQ